MIARLALAALLGVAVACSSSGTRGTTSPGTGDTTGTTAATTGSTSGTTDTTAGGAGTTGTSTQSPGGTVGGTTGQGGWQSGQPGQTGAGSSMGSSGSGVTQGASGAGGADSTFVQQAVIDSLAEIQLAQLAQQQSQNPQVRALAQQLVTDHQQISQALQQAAPGLGIPVSTQIPSQYQQQVQQLSSLQGQDFDRQFLQTLVQNHQQSLQVFQREAQSGSMPQLQTWAQRVVPHLQQHLDAAQSLLGQVGGQSSPNNGSQGVQPPPGGQNGSSSPGGR